MTDENQLGDSTLESSQYYNCMKSNLRDWEFFVCKPSLFPSTHTHQIPVCKTSYHIVAGDGYHNASDVSLFVLEGEGAMVDESADC
ncbi:unnamed protein product [Sphagnum jensenii]